MLPTIQVWEDRLGQRDASRESGSHCDSSLEGMDSNFQSPKDPRTAGQTAQTILHPILVRGPSFGVRSPRCRRDEIRTPRSSVR
jgi:hypothetical protein